RGKIASGPFILNGEHGQRQRYYDQARPGCDQEHHADGENHRADHGDRDPAEQPNRVLHIYKHAQPTPVLPSATASERVTGRARVRGSPPAQTPSVSSRRARTSETSATRSGPGCASRSWMASSPARSVSRFSLSTHSPAAASRPWPV